MSINRIYEKLAYIKGLADGMDIKAETKEAKLLLSIVEMLEDFVEFAADINESQREMEEYIESIDEDIAEIEDEVFGFDGEEDLNTVEISCPNCKESIYVDEDLIYDEDMKILCPRCKTVIVDGEEMKSDECSDIQE